jgi:nucleoside-diphosphate-sugar epimerase
VSDPLQATDHYCTHKLACEAMAQSSGLPWTIFRLADIPPLRLHSPHPCMLRIPLQICFEVIHPYDGGPTCQILYRDYLGRMREMMGIKIQSTRAGLHRLVE